MIYALAALAVVIVAIVAVRVFSSLIHHASQSMEFWK